MQVSRVRVGAIDTICYIVSANTKNAAIIDPGSDAEKIISTIERLNLVPKYILLTHGHYDHIEAIKPLKDKYNLPVIVGAKDVYLINDQLWSNYLGRPFPQVNYDRAIIEGGTITLDELTIQALETPGHSPGSISYLVGDAIFTGDCLFANGGVGRTDLWQGSFEDIKHSITETLFKLPAETTVYPGHGNSSTIGKEKEIHRTHNILEH